MKLRKVKDRNRNEWDLRLFDDDEKIIGHIVVGEWGESFRVHVHSRTGNLALGETNLASHIAIYPSDNPEGA